MYLSPIRKKKTVNYKTKKALKDVNKKYYYFFLTGPKNFKDV